MKNLISMNNVKLFFNKYLKLILVFFVSFQWSLNAQKLITHDFDNESFFPYVVPKADQESRVKIVNKSVETHWDQSLYNGTNSGRKAQIKQAAGDHTDDEVQFKQHIWMGFSIKIHNDYMKDNTNTNAGLMQIWGYNSNSGTANHMCMLKFDGRNGGALVWQHRYNSVANKTHYLIQDNFPRDQFVDVVIHVQLKNKDEGTVEIWIDGELKVNKTNQTIGWGDMDETGMINETYAFGTSIGQYNYLENASIDDAYDGDGHQFDGHMAGETRTVTYDNVSLYNGANGYSLVNPEGEEETPVIPITEEGAIVHITKRNATGFAIDSGTGGSNGQNVTLSSANTSDEGQLWLEIDRGNGFYSYEKYGTNYSLDGNSGGVNNQSVYLWETNDTNQNQQWEKEAVGDGGYKLIKRNATDFAINGGSGGIEGRDINLYDSSNSSQNLQWYITPIVTNTRLEAEDFDNMSGIQTESTQDTNGGENVGWINDGDWLRFDDVELSGITNMDARIACDFTGGTVEVRTGSATGTLIGSINVNNTGGNQNWTTLNTSVSNVNGTQDVYLVFTGGNGYLFNVNWIEFNTSSSRSNKDITAVSELIDVIIYPNPVSSTTTIKNVANSILNVYDINGNTVFTKLISSDSEVLDLSSVATGVYFLKVDHEERVNTKLKLIKK